MATTTQAPVKEPKAPEITAPAPDITDVIREGEGMNAMLTTRQPKKEKKKEAAAPVVEPVKKEAAAPAVDAPVVAPVISPVKVRQPKPRAPELTEERIAEIAAATTAKMQPAAPKVAETSAVELPESLRHLAPVYEQLEKLNPKKYAGLAKKQTEFAQKELDYATQWEDREIQKLQAAGQYDPENPPVYNDQDPQHSSFYKRNQVQIDPTDLKKAEFETMWDEKYQSTVAPKLTEAERTITNLRAAPQAAAAVSDFGEQLFVALNPEAKGKVSPDTYKAWSAANPVEAEVAHEIHNQAQPVVEAVSMLWDGAVEFDQKNDIHLNAAKVLHSFESEIASQPNAVENDKGQTWVPLEKYNKLTDAQKAKHFTTTKQNLVSYIGLNSASRTKEVAKQQKEYAEKMAEKMGYTKTKPSPVTGQPPITTPPVIATPLASPSVSSGSPIPATTGVAPSTEAPKGDAMASMLGVK